MLVRAYRKRGRQPGEGCPRGRLRLRLAGRERASLPEKLGRRVRQSHCQACCQRHARGRQTGKPAVAGGRRSASERSLLWRLPCCWCWLGCPLGNLRSPARRVGKAFLLTLLLVLRVLLARFGRCLYGMLSAPLPGCKIRSLRLFPRRPFCPLLQRRHLVAWLLETLRRWWRSPDVRPRVRRRRGAGLRRRSPGLEARGRGSPRVMWVIPAGVSRCRTRSAAAPHAGRRIAGKLERVDAGM